jgi:2-polyprenyl-6-methoxyphenol hydroxylase-like FAD-dependent oxidoreductase
MQIVVVGAGPTGLFLGMTLARRGHGVTVVDRDSGPRPDGSWSRRGVMQFDHPHAFRAQVVEALQAELPDTWDDLLASGAEPMMAPR